MNRLIACCLTVLVTACGSDSATPSTPPEVELGRDTCLECGMILSDIRFVAAYEHEGEERLFDDVGDMVTYGLRSGELGADTPAWVHDYLSGRWVDAQSARYVVTEDLMTPMGHGTVALSTAGDAAALAAEFGGEVLTWEDLLARPPAGEISHEHEG